MEEIKQKTNMSTIKKNRRTKERMDWQMEGEKKKEEVI